MTEGTYDIDVAITFVNEDLSFANELRESLSSSLNIFVYSARQEELAGTDGLQTLREVFRNRARLVVILNRARWGKTDWSRVEEEAITDRFLKEGPAFLFVVMMDDSAPPPWLPDKLIRFNLKDFGIEQAVGAIKVRALERGSTIHRPSIAELAAQANERAAFAERRARLFKTDEGVRQASQEADSLMKLLVERSKEAKEAAAGLNVGFGARAQGWVIRTRHVALACGYLNRIINVLDEAKLFIREFRGQVLLPGQSGYYLRNPRELDEMVFSPDLMAAQGWCWKSADGKIWSSEQIAELCLTRFFALVDRHSKGELPPLLD